MRRALLLPFLFVALSCSDQSPKHPFEGTWNLETIDGVAVPRTISWKGSQLQVTQQHFWINPDGSGLWSSDGTGEFDAGGLIESTNIVGNSLGLVAAPGTTFGFFPQGLFDRQSDNVITYNEQNRTFLFRRE